MFSKWYFSNDGSFLFAVGCSHFFVGCKKFIIGYKVILLTVQANCVTKKTLELRSSFLKRLLHLLWSFSKVPRVLQLSHWVLIYAWTVHVKWCDYLCEFILIFTWVWYYLLAENFALKVAEGFCPVIKRLLNYLLFNAACAAASLAIGTRNGEQET